MSRSQRTRTSPANHSAIHIVAAGCAAQMQQGFRSQPRHSWFSFPCDATIDVHSPRRCQLEFQLTARLSDRHAVGQLGRRTTGATARGGSGAVAWWWLPADVGSRRSGGSLVRVAYGISRTMIRLVPPLAPVCRPAVITTRAPVGRPANTFAVSRADSTRSSTVAPAGMVRGYTPQSRVSWSAIACS